MRWTKLQKPHPSLLACPTKNFVYRLSGTKGVFAELAYPVAVRSGIVKFLSKTIGAPGPRITGKSTISMQPSGKQVKREVTLTTASEKLKASVNAMRMAVEASDSAIGDLGIIPGSEDGDESPEIRRRWVASSALLHGALKGLEADCRAVSEAVQDLLRI